MKKLKASLVFILMFSCTALPETLPSPGFILQKVEAGINGDIVSSEEKQHEQAGKNRQADFWLPLQTIFHVHWPGEASEGNTDGSTTNTGLRKCVSDDTVWLAINHGTSYNHRHLLKIHCIADSGLNNLKRLFHFIFMKYYELDIIISTL